MLQISFTQFRNKLSRVLGTRQRTAAKASVTSMETESEGEGAVVKSRSKNIKKDGKINAQASQIKELCTKLDEAVDENSQMRGFLSPTALQTAFTNALQVVKKYDPSNPNLRTGPQPFWGKL